MGLKLGETVKLYGVVVMLDTVYGVNPSVYVIVHGDTPVNVTFNPVLIPSHISVTPFASIKELTRLTITSGDPES